MSKLIESEFYEKERKYIEKVYLVLPGKINPDEIYVVGSPAGKIYLYDKNNFLKTSIFPVSKDVDILIKNEDVSNLLQLTESYPVYKTIYKRGRLDEIYLPFKNYKLNEETDIFVGSVCAIPATKNTYKIEGNVVYKGFSLNAPEKSFIFATYINPLAMTIDRLNRFFILATDEYVKNGEEQLKTKIDDTLYYVALGSEVVGAKKEELKNKDPYNPILFVEDFNDYDVKFKKLPNFMTNDYKKLVRIAMLSEFPKDEAERTARIIIERVRNEYERILKDVKRK